MYIFGKTPITLKEQAQDKERELKDLIRKSVPEEIINQANIMGKSNGSRGDLVELIYQQLFLIDPTADNKEKNMTQQQAYESLVSTLLGAIGTVYFNRHIDSLNTSNRKNEIDLNNGTKKGASADIMYNQNGEIHVVELKTGNGLILEESECKWKPSESEKEISRGSLDGIIGLPSEEERQIHNGRAALEQAKKLCLYRDKVKKENNQDVVVHVAYFRGCDVSTSLSQELSDLGVKKFQIPFDVEKIYDYINNLLGYIYDTGRNIMNPVENHRKISLPSMPPFMEENTGYGEIEVNKIESMRERF